MERLIKAAEINRLVFGSPLLKLRSNSITRQEVLDMLYNKSRNKKTLIRKAI